MNNFQKIKSFISNNKFPILIFFGLSFAISLTFPTGFSIRYSYQLNDIANEPIIAPFDFGILKTNQKLNKDLDEARNSVPFSFSRDQDFVNKQIAIIDTFFIYLNDIYSAHDLFISSQDSLYKYRYEPEFESFQSSFIADSTTYVTLYSEFLDQYQFQIDKAQWDQLLGINESLPEPLNLELFKNQIKQICLNRWAEGIIDEPLENILSDEISIIQGGELVIAPTKNYNDIETAWKKNREEVNQLYENKLDIQSILSYELINEFTKPNILFDKKLTESRQKERLDKVSRFQGTVLANELIVDTNNRITESVLLKLKSLQFESERRLGYERAADKFREYLGAFFIVSILLFLLFSFFYIYRGNYFENYKILVLIGFLMYLIVFFSWIIVSYQLPVYIIPIAMFSILLTVLLDTMVSLISSTILILLVSLLIGNDLDFSIVQFFISFIAILSVRKLRKRRQIITTMLTLVLCSLFVFFSVMLFKGIDFLDYNYSTVGYLALSSFLCPILAFGLVPLFESFFGITTDLSLIELLDYDQPLLKKLMEDAPGTHTHSVKVGTLAESCANAIGARALLCRVGSYYHDIGKIKKPEYYAENQTGGNKHDSITPYMSAKILKQHVTDGLALADEYGLPNIVKDFIETHHAKNRMEFFYKKALEKDSKVDENEFRYPGPKPSSKETGIVMLAEAIEAQANSLKNPTLEKFESMIDKAIRSRLEDGQLDECPLTMEDLQKIKGRRDSKHGLLPVLSGLYHSRPEYPSKDDE
ncbi:MAG: HDIG domain-containing protein [Candidatus Marinimicrobia bacterium]|nr:HDIG domain-containing protein [Candidatus Neomarinimicrobiota bacterium]MDA1363125.1 HDIG domain-containing protein [Candidatus Neomarinimicrobiota bacterium]